LDCIQVVPVSGVPEVKTGADIGEVLLKALKLKRLRLHDWDIVVVKQKIVSKAEGRLVSLDDVTPSAKAKAHAARYGKDPRLVELVLREAVRVVRDGHGVLITETRHGFVCANSGVDQSNVGHGRAALLPVDPDRSASLIRRTLESATGAKLAVIITDSFGRPWRNGQTDVAIGCSGIHPLYSYAGKSDKYGYKLKVTKPAVVDEVAGAAELATRKLSGVPAAVVRGVAFVRSELGISPVLMPRSRDLFR
jgi:coenzyme F420-0:L-glutamate ligase/coenzyme F420-1:gamma-L-glutamate ligase